MTHRAGARAARAARAEEPQIGSGTCPSETSKASAILSGTEKPLQFRCDMPSDSCSAPSLPKMAFSCKASPKLCNLGLGIDSRCLCQLAPKQGMPRTPLFGSAPGCHAPTQHTDAERFTLGEVWPGHVQPAACMLVDAGGLGSDVRRESIWSTFASALEKRSSSSDKWDSARTCSALTFSCSRARLSPAGTFPWLKNHEPTSRTFNPNSENSNTLQASF